MTLQPEPTIPPEILEQQVLEHLRAHPDFFTKNPDLLRELELPHASGEAVSLIEHQVKALRKQAAQYKTKLADFIEVVQENEDLNQRLHRLTLTLIDTLDFDEVVNALQDQLHENFMVDAVELHLFFSDEVKSEEHPDLDGFRSFIDAGTPQCGPLPRERLDYLFGPQAEDIVSTALIPIQSDGVLGVLAFGSRSEERFHPGMRTEYLTRLSEIVSKTLEVVSKPGV